jgi:lysophospholipase L1-like esterase
MTTQAGITNDPSSRQTRKAYRILPLGDSITRGKAGASYREGLKQLLAAKGIAIDYVGSGIDQKGPHGPGHDIDTPYTEAQIKALDNDLEHDGWGGYKISDLDRHLDELLAQAHPDFVLLMIGTNDIDQKEALNEAPQRLESLLQRIRALVPAARIFCASVPPCLRTEGDLELTLEYNRRIPGIVERLNGQPNRGQQKPIVFAEVYSAMDPAIDLLPDKVHPNAHGFEMIARAWADCLLANR